MQFNGGVSVQTLAVLALLPEPSEWACNYPEFVLSVTQRAYYNGREKGICLFFHEALSSDGLNVVFFEHRNTDDICFLIWEEDNYRPAISYQDVPSTLWDVSARFNYLEIGSAVSEIKEAVYRWRGHVI